jgi:hypothetical protein
MSTSPFYDWLGGDTHAPGGREAADARLLADMRKLYADDDTLGWPRMTQHGLTTSVSFPLAA